MSRGATINTAAQLITEECYRCGVTFAMPKDMRDHRLKDHESFYCPNGHGQSYTGPTEEEKRIAALEKQLEWSRKSAAMTQEQLESARKERTVLKGQLTKTKKRVAKGVCPCCNRQFVDLHRHMNTKHPDYAESAVGT